MLYFYIDLTVNVLIVHMATISIHFVHPAIVCTKTQFYLVNFNGFRKVILNIQSEKNRTFFKVSPEIVSPENVRTFVQRNFEETSK